MCFRDGDDGDASSCCCSQWRRGRRHGRENGWLGRHVQSHIDYNSARLVDVDRKRMEQVFPNVYLKGRKYQPKLRVTAERQQEDETLNIAGAISFISLGSVERDVRQMKSAARNLLRGNWSAIGVRDTLPALRRLPILMQLAYSFYVSHRAYWPQDVTYWLRVHCEQEPLSASRITLAPERDAMGMFRSRIDWQVSPLEWKTIQRFTQMAQACAGECRPGEAGTAAGAGAGRRLSPGDIRR